MIINRYLILEISKPLAVVLGVLVILFASYSAVSLLSDAVNGLLPTDTIAEILGLKAVISLEVLIPISLYMSVILSLGKLYSESEIAAMFALTVSPARLMSAVLALSAGLALVVACVSIYARPWAYRQLHELSAAAESSVNFDDMEAGTFYEDKHGRWMIFIGHRKGVRSIADNVFVKYRFGERVQTIYALHAHQELNAALNGKPEIHLTDARVYEIGRNEDEGDQVVVAEDQVGTAKEIILSEDSLAVEIPGYSALATSSAKLAKADSAEDIAEFQWRLSTPLSTLLLGMLGVPLSRTKPRQGRYAKMGIAIVVYFSYYLLCTSARTWVQKGDVAAFPGIWWSPCLLILGLIGSWFAPSLQFWVSRRHVQHG